MKLLGWMHRKLRQNTTTNETTTPKDFPIDDHMLHCYQKGNHGTPFGKAQRGNYYRNSFTSLDSARVEHENHNDPEDNDDDDDDDDDITDHFFHGFLAIGTLGCGTEQFSTTEPSTPTFNSISAIAEKETQVTENELKLINDELEKVLLAGDDVSSGRNSQVSAGRISCCSAVTLVSGGDTCPLQSYLFGSAVDTAAPPAAKKEQRRTSLGDLFQKTKDHQTTASTTDKSAVHVMKKMLKKTINNVHKSSTPIDSDKKLHKILQMFTRKVHPENPTATATATATAGGSCDNNKAPTKSNNVGSDHGGSCYSEDIIIYPQVQAAAAAKEDIVRCCKKSQSLTTTHGNHEFWVKTDADYLVLEL